MNTIQEYRCSACNKIFDFYTINKHLKLCDKYDEWIKNYIPPKIIICEFCKLNFNESNFENHKINCKNNK
jgi:hypothetical protein